MTAPGHHVGALSERILELVAGYQPEDMRGVVHHLRADLVGGGGELLERSREQEDGLAEQGDVGLGLSNQLCSGVDVWLHAALDPWIGHEAQPPQSDRAHAGMRDVAAVGGGDRGDGVAGVSQSLQAGHVRHCP